MFARYLLTAAALVVHGVLGQTTTNTTQFGGSGPNAIILTGPTVIKQCGEFGCPSCVSKANSQNSSSLNGKVASPPTQSSSTGLKIP